jgi:hypothetical protein
VTTAKEEFGVRIQGDDLGVQGDARTDETAEERGVVGGTHELHADIHANLAEGDLLEVGVEAKTAAVPPLIGNWESIEMRGAELAVNGGLSLGCRDADCEEEEQGEKGAVQAGTTGRKTIHSEKSLYERGGVTACWQ